MGSSEQTVVSWALFGPKEGHIFSLLPQFRATRATSWPPMARRLITDWLAALIANRPFLCSLI